MEKLKRMIKEMERKNRSKQETQKERLVGKRVLMKGREKLKGEKMANERIEAQKKWEKRRQEKSENMKTNKYIYERSMAIIYIYIAAATER